MGGAHDVSRKAITQILNALSAGDELVPLVYAELRRVAASYLLRERVGHMLEPTALVHEAYLRLVNASKDGWQNPRTFSRVPPR